ncbi:Hypothetical protein FKW44_003145 [Caligus rogercresseyi]|uniref:Uncharacterized protein n=1 Tax=Caligus rogercresseyi TaxID=217165 RepID=A0A7T8KL64_CALRO|nr:Hypothetical protein FKW44_003145 [Caligus rogercresseyi]
MGGGGAHSWTFIKNRAHVIRWVVGPTSGFRTLLLNDDVTNPLQRRELQSYENRNSQASSM